MRKMTPGPGGAGGIERYPGLRRLDRPCGVTIPGKAMLEKGTLLGLMMVATVMAKGDDDVPAEAKEPVERGPRQGRPFNLGINIPHIFNMKLLTGADGTGLGIDIPAILRLRLDKGGLHGGRPSSGLFINLFGSDIVSGKRAPVVLRPAADYDTEPAEITKKSAKEA